MTEPLRGGISDYVKPVPLKGTVMSNGSQVGSNAPHMTPAGSRDLGAKREVVALLLAQGMSALQAAKEAHLNERTVRGWQGEQEVADRVRWLRMQMTERAVGLAAEGLVTAVTTLTTEAKTGKTPTIRIRAAEALIAAFTKLHDSTQLTKEVDEMKVLIGVHLGGSITDE